jgi:coproporphyrinogen III oxidase-like Fe-S oxidoreductase
MNDLVAHFVCNCHIDSIQKIFLLLFLNQHPEMEGSSQEFGTFLYLGNSALMEKIVADLQQAGLIVQVENGYRLSDKPEVRLYLHSLAEAFADPLIRQQLLDLIKHNGAHSASTPVNPPE